MMKLKIFFFSIFFIPSFLFAKEEVLKIHDLDLKIYTPDYHIEKIIDAREHIYSIGFVQKGLGNQRKIAVFEKGLENELNLLFQKSMLHSSTSTPLILRINKFFLYEVNYQTVEIAVVDMNFTLLQKIGEEYYEIFELGNTQERGGVDATSYHPKNMIKGISKFFQHYHKYKKKGKTTMIKISETQVSQNSLNHLDQPILKKEIIPKGAFYYFTDFKECLPDTTADFSIEQIRFNRIEEFKITWKNKEKEEVKRPHYLWGVSDGKNVFVNINNRFYKIKKEENDFLVNGEILESNGTNLKLNIGLSALVSGAIGGVAIFYQVGAKTSYKDQKFKIDLNTGSAMPLKDHDYFDIN